MKTHSCNTFDIISGSTKMTAKGLVAIVTGGASALGRATISRLVKEGNKVLLCDVASSKGADVANEFGDDAKFVPTNICYEDDVINAMNITKRTFGKLNIVVNCAGISHTCQTYNWNSRKEHPLGDFENVLKFNITGVFNVCRLACKLMHDNEPDSNVLRGLIINTASSACYNGMEGQIAYSISQAGISGMTLPLAQDLQVIGIRVCCIIAGLFDNMPLTSQLPGNVNRYLSTLPLAPQRFGKPEEFAQLVQSVIDNPFLNGVNIKLDGGLNRF